MNKEFDFSRIGKRLPYTAPEGFLDQMEDQVMATLKDEMHTSPLDPSSPQVSANEKETPKVMLLHSRHQKRIIYSVFGGLVAASIALLLVFGIQGKSQKVDDLEVLEQAFSQLSPSDQNYLLTVYQNDLFLNQ